jgi:hypothetical protein
VANISAANRADPKLMHHLLSREITPAIGNVSLVPALIDHNRLLKLFAPSDDLRQVAILDADVG